MLRSALHHERISVRPGVVRPGVMGGKPCIKGTRIPVDLILDNLDGGPSREEILEACPGLTLDDVRAAEAYARARAD